jgi:hypothetical protein
MGTTRTASWWDLRTVASHSPKDDGSWVSAGFRADALPMSFPSPATLEGYLVDEEGAP